MNVELKEEIDKEEILMAIDLWEIFVINNKGWKEEMVTTDIIDIKITIEEMIIKDKEKDREMITTKVQDKIILDSSIIKWIIDLKIKITLQDINIEGEKMIENMSSM